jgi:hypothetical protein
MSRPPMVCADLYEAVTSRGIGCQCDNRQGWGCGRDHPYGGHTCCESAHDGRPLVVVARDPHLPLHKVTALPPDELVALCRGCATRRANAAKKAAAQPADADGREQLALFAA